MKWGMSEYLSPSIQSGCFRASLSFLLLFSQSFPPHLFRSRCIRSSRYNACSEPPLGTVNIFIYFRRNAAYKIPARHAGEQRHDRIIEIMVHEIFEKSVDIYAVIVFISCKRTFNFFLLQRLFLRLLWLFWLLWLLPSWLLCCPLPVGCSRIPRLGQKVCLHLMKGASVGHKNRDIHYPEVGRNA